MKIEPMMTAHDIAEILRVSARQVAERYSMMPDFPKAIPLPSPKGRGVKRWKQEDISAWLERLQKRIK